jgi:hypothetical protein
LTRGARKCLPVHGTARRLVLIRWAGLATALGGLLWAAKGSAILLTGDQPEYLFELAPLFFALGLLALHARLEGGGGNAARLGGALAWSGLALVLASAALYLATGEEEGFPIGITIPLAALSILAALVLLGIAVRRTEALPGRWRSLPLAMGAGVIPLMIVGGILEMLDERLLEIPIVLVGLAWSALGYAVWRHTSGPLAKAAPTRA